MTEIAGKAAVVTGGGIGMGLVKELPRQGAAVAIADILPDTARAVADEIDEAGGTAIATHCDVSDRSSIDQMYRPERFGGPSDERMKIPHASLPDLTIDEGTSTCLIRPSPSFAPRASSTWTSARCSREPAWSSRGTSSPR